MPKPKANTIMPSAQEDAVITAAALTDPDARPFTEEEWAQAKMAVQGIKTNTRDKSYAASLEVGLTDPLEAAAYIDAVKTQNDDAALVLALRHVANANDNTLPPVSPRDTIGYD